MSFINITTGELANIKFDKINTNSFKEYLKTDGKIICINTGYMKSIDTSVYSSIDNTIANKITIDISFENNELVNNINLPVSNIGKSMNLQKGKKDGQIRLHIPIKKDKDNISIDINNVKYKTEVYIINGKKQYKVNINKNVLWKLLKKNSEVKFNIMLYNVSKAPVFNNTIFMQLNTIFMQLNSIYIKYQDYMRYIPELSYLGLNLIKKTTIIKPNNTDFKVTNDENNIEHPIIEKYPNIKKSNNNILNIIKGTIMQ
jgi:hypothetical protein